MENILNRIRELDITDLSDGVKSKVSMDHSVKPILAGKKIVGPAFTVKLPLGDSLGVARSIDFAKPGDVLVIDTAGSSNNAVWGDLRSLSAKHKGLEGAVIDGAIRDIVTCREIGFPLFSKYIVPASSGKSSPGELNIPINCGDLIVNPGDIIVGDENGVIVLPRDRIEEIIEAAEEKRIQNEKLKNEILEV